MKEDVVYEPAVHLIQTAVIPAEESSDQRFIIICHHRLNTSADAKGSHSNCAITITPLTRTHLC